MKNVLRTAAFVLVLALLSGCTGKLPENKVYSREDMEGKLVGVVKGTVAESHLAVWGDRVSVQTFDSVKKLAKALRDGLVDCAVCGEESLKDVKKAARGIEPLEEEFLIRSYRMAVSVDNPELLRRLNETLEALRENGTAAKIIDGGKAGALPAAPGSFTGETVTVAVAVGFYPYAYYEGEELTGIEVRLVQAVCQYLGLTPEFVPASEDKYLYLAESGKVSFAIGRITEGDGGEGILYTDPYDVDKQLILVRKG